MRSYTATPAKSDCAYANAPTGMDRRGRGDGERVGGGERDIERERREDREKRREKRETQRERAGRDLHGRVG
jgi:hypothetical protein